MNLPVFLLGGYDLEMLEIRNLLEQQNAIYYDRALRWDNAVLDAYTTELEIYQDSDKYLIYGIELRYGKTTPPENYHLIDHHNQYEKEPSPLTTVAKLLNITLSRHQQLVAINDVSYIPGMIAFGATEQEVAQVRKKDREVQGVTQEDEDLAIKAIDNNKEELPNLTIIKALSPKFSPICDRLFPYKNLLIHTDEEFMFYGWEREQIREYFKAELEQGKMFCGGGETGFIGAAEKAYTKTEIGQYTQQIKTLITNNYE